ncbi:MAG: hypothetical protein KBT34_04920 [Prevotella sp.]|nr:hypothetical protein [Candidatus Prevotella equi]
MNNVQITAVAKEFKNGNKGWTVFVEGMGDKHRAEMNFSNPLKAMRYMFLLSKRLSVKINEVELLAISLEYKRTKTTEATPEIVEEVKNTVEEVAEEMKEEEKAPETPKEKKPRKKRTSKKKEEKAE